MADYIFHSAKTVCNTGWVYSTKEDLFSRPPLFQVFSQIRFLISQTYLNQKHAHSGEVIPPNLFHLPFPVDLDLNVTLHRAEIATGT